VKKLRAKEKEKKKVCVCGEWALNKKNKKTNTLDWQPGMYRSGVDHI
jgi:hypothetical protein